MKSSFWSQVAIVLLAVLLSLYFWLGYWAIVVALIVVIAIVIVAIVKAYRRKKSADNSQFKPKPITATLKDRSAEIIEGRKEQADHFFDTARLIVASKPELERVVGRLLDWYTDYLRTNSVYQYSIYDYMFNRIKERQCEAKASYLKRELQISKTIIRAMMRGCGVDEILERLEENDS